MSLESVINAVWDLVGPSCARIAATTGNEA
jgi:hypothetical protein